MKMGKAYENQDSLSIVSATVSALCCDHAVLEAGL
jgi:hypothetical protein